jgi:hypothetical protein
LDRVKAASAVPAARAGATRNDTGRSGSIPVPEFLPFSGEDTFAAADSAVRRSFVDANSRFDAFEKGEYPVSDVEAWIARELDAGWAPHVRPSQCGPHAERRRQLRDGASISRVSDARTWQVFKEALRRLREHGVNAYPSVKLDNR